MRKKLAVASVIVIVLGSVLIGFVLGAWWYAHKQSDRWDSNALRAVFNAAQVEGDLGKEHPVFFYRVENTTDRDYSVREASDLQLFVKEKGALDNWPGSGLTIDLPIFIPAHDKSNVTVHFKVIEREQPRSSSASDVQQFLSDKKRIWNSYEAFVIFDHRYRYRIEFPIGPWTSQKMP